MNFRTIKISPVVLFVYNRPWHTEQTLNALVQNELADQSVLYIYADGPKENATDEEMQKIEEVKEVISSKKWCKEVHIIKAETNKGLAESIITGVTEIVNQYGKVIVLEDDIVTSKGFLKYMNDALELYKEEDKVYHISGYMFPVKGKLPETFFNRQTSCWGWATWAKQWNQLETSPKKLMKKLEERNLVKEADIDGTNQFIIQLQSNINGTMKTWAVLWHFSVFLNNGLCLHPRKSLVKNIGLDNSGENCGTTSLFNVIPVESISLKKIKIKDYKKVYAELKDFYQPRSKNHSFNTFKNKISLLIPSNVKHKIKLYTNKSFKESELRKITDEKEAEMERLRIQNLPRFTETDIDFLNKRIHIVDIASFSFMRKEIFDQQIYKFDAHTEEPYIIDCGSNIGLSIMYFKSLYPAAEIVGFEPDDKVFEALERNIKSFNLFNVELIKKACWNKETTLKFYSEGADGGRVAKDFDTEQIIEVETIRLRNFLHRKVDFLKIDIEGAEAIVLEDCSELLANVEKIFVEYHSFIGKEQKLPELLTILKAARFRLHISSPGLISKNPYLELNTYSQMDNQLNIYGFR